MDAAQATSAKHVVASVGHFSSAQAKNAETCALQSTGHDVASDGLQLGRVPQQIANAANKHGMSLRNQHVHNLLECGANRGQQPRGAGTARLGP